MAEDIQPENVEILVGLLHDWKKRTTASVIFQPLEIALAAEKFAKEIREDSQLKSYI